MTAYFNCFELLDTYGLPLAIQYDTLRKEGLVPAMDKFVYDAIRAGWSFDKAINAVWECWAETEGPARANELRGYLEAGCRQKIAKGALK